MHFEMGVSTHSKMDKVEPREPPPTFGQLLPTSGKTSERGGILLKQESTQKQFTRNREEFDQLIIHNSIGRKPQPGLSCTLPTMRAFHGAFARKQITKADSNANTL
jgi:hypothetical protein